VFTKIAFFYLVQAGLNHRAINENLLLEPFPEEIFTVDAKLNKVERR
jgi:hypothetical protein